MSDDDDEHREPCEDCGLTDEECTQQIHDTDEPCCPTCYHPLTEEDG